MADLFIQALIVCALAIAGWWLSERLAPDPLLDRLVKLIIFCAVIYWAITHLLPRVL